jgi:protein-S-isoprenylcysteine O-methyltransferase Ste14
MVVFGSALVLLVEATHLCRRFEGASVTPSLWRRTIAWWTSRATISLAIAIVIAVLAPLIAVSLPASWAPFIAGIGVLATFAAAIAFAWPTSDD